VKINKGKTKFLKPKKGYWAGLSRQHDPDNAQPYLELPPTRA
jgi:hypothetical protein